MTANTNPTWTTAVTDWQERIVSGKSLLPNDLPINEKVADVALRIFDSLILVDVIGKPTIGQATKQWARDFVRVIFGCYDPVARQRLISEFFLLISKKNSKSTLASAIMITALILNDRHSAELAIIAPTKEVASNSFNPARDMIKADPELSAMFNISEHTRTITHLGTQATLKVYASESDTVSGGKFNFVLVDELWIFGKRANADAMLREATGGLVSRPEGFVIYLTTMSDEPPAGVMKSKLDYARDVRDGKVDDNRFLPLLYEFPQAMLDDQSYLDPINWHITNPNIGLSVKQAWLEREYKKAVEEGKEQTQTFTAKHLNVQIGIAMRANRWGAVEFWDQAKTKPFTLDELIEKSEVITIGGDGGGLDDLLGQYVIGRLPNKKWWGWCRAWCHEIALERRKKIAPTLLDFAKDGDLIIVKKVGEETRQFAEICKKIYDSGKLDRIGLDPVRIGLLLEMLESMGIPSDKIIGVSQGFKMAGHILTAELKIARQDMLHADQPLMNWCIGNTRTVVKGSGVMIDKAESGSGKIDPVIAMLNATALMSENPQPPNRQDINDYLDNMVIA